jgi:membrane protease YdiL (CAAX protease family)
MQDSSAHSLISANRLVPIMIGFAWVALYIVLVAPAFIFSALGGIWLGRVTWAGLEPVFHGTVWVGGVLLITWIVRVRLNRRSWSGLALPPPQLARLALGALAGFLLIVVAALVEYELGWLHAIHIDTGLHRGVNRSLWMLLAIAPSLAVGFSEELAFRGYVFGTFAERMPIWAAAISMSVIFALAHFSLSGFDPAFVIAVTTISFMFLLFRFVTGSLWFAMGFHAAWDWTQTYLVGLSTTGVKHNPALVEIAQTGPRFWVGSQQAIESGALFILISLTVIACTLVYAARVGKLPPWKRRLDAESCSSPP